MQEALPAVRADDLGHHDHADGGGIGRDRADLGQQRLPEVAVGRRHDLDRDGERPRRPGRARLRDVVGAQLDVQGEDVARAEPERIAEGVARGRVELGDRQQDGRLLLARERPAQTVRVGHDRHVGEHDVLLALQAQPQRERRAAAQDGDQRAALEQLGHDERGDLARRVLELPHVPRNRARDGAFARERQEWRPLAGESAPGLRDAADAGLGHVDRLEAIAGDRTDVAQRLGRCVVERAHEQHHRTAHDGVVAARVS